MSIHISFNGRDVQEFGIVPLEGTLIALTTPAAFKKLSTNSNMAFDGVIPVTKGNRKRDSRSFTLNFLLRSTSIIDRERDIESLDKFLSDGVGHNGLNEIYVAELEQCYRVVYDGLKPTNYPNFEKAFVALKFIEYCPTPENRVPTL